MNNEVFRELHWCRHIDIRAFCWTIVLDLLDCTLWPALLAAFFIFYFELELLCSCIKRSGVKCEHRAHRFMYRVSDDRHPTLYDGIHEYCILIVSQRKHALNWSRSSYTPLLGLILAPTCLISPS